MANKTIVLTTKDADSIISLLRDTQRYLQRNFDETEKNMISLKDEAAKHDRQGVLKKFTETLFEETLKEGRNAFNEDNEKFNDAILLLTAGSNIEE